jgi:hypothetical protein
MNYRNAKLRESAKHESCVSCGRDDGTVVWAHSNQQRHGKGMGIKAHDLFGAYLCHDCHDLLDGRITGRTNLFKIPIDKDAWFREMWERSMITACEKGYL